MIQEKEDTIGKSIVIKHDFDFGIHQYECMDGQKEGRKDGRMYFFKTCVNGIVFCSLPYLL